MSKVKPLRLFFIRHGQTENFDVPPFNGWRDASLTDYGRRQLDQVAAGLAAVPFDAVYSSDLSRAVYGGERLARAVGRDLLVDPKWREMHFGRWEGLTYQEIYGEDRDFARRISSPEGGDLPFPGGESSVIFTRRVSEALSGLRQNFPDGGRVAVVCHGGVCKALWGLILSLPAHIAWTTVRQDFAAVNVADLYPSGHNTAHLVNGYLGPEGYHGSGPGFERLLGADLF
ncbi:MAG: histidine phosphatase family protein [Candidatus Adiutrix sp.]|jgi:broad specificity phosphatase PhoE|nr:histidine phosphatase family protein [Candidatus Adiutrix sp.]